MAYTRQYMYIPSYTSFYFYFTGNKGSEKLDDLVTNTRLLTDMKKLSPTHQTGGLKAYHSVINNFAPKLLAFSYCVVPWHCVNY